MRSSTKRGRPPDGAVGEEPPDRSLRPSKTRTFPMGDVVPQANNANVETGPDIQSTSDHIRPRPSRPWIHVRQRLCDAHGILRALLFIQIVDERVCLRLRGFLQFHQWSTSWMALCKTNLGLESSLSLVIEDLQRILPQNKKEALNEPELLLVLSAILAHILRGDCTEYRPLVDKLDPEDLQRMEQLLGEEYTHDLSMHEELADITGFRSWFTIRARSPDHTINRSLTDILAFPRVSDWIVHESDQQTRWDAFARMAARAQETTELTVRRMNLNRDRKARQDQSDWSCDQEHDYERAMQEIKERNSALLDEKKQMLLRTRKYRLFPTQSQRQVLKRFMGTCRWTYNQAVAHFRATHDSNAQRLARLYVTKDSKMTRTYPDGMSPPPEWAFETPSTMRNCVMRSFERNVKSAYANVMRGNIKSFSINYSSKKKHPDFTFSDNARNVKITQRQTAFYLTISKLRDIRVKMDSRVAISGQIDILYKNGFWYVAIPQYVEPEPYVYRNTCIALDPGIKAFMTGVDLEGNVMEFGRGTKYRLDAIRKRRDASQSALSKFKNRKGRSKRWEYRSYVRAKRVYSSCVAKLKNCVKDLHYKTCSYLTKHYNVIILPIFQTKGMLKKSTARTHGFNTNILSLNHYQFRSLLQAKSKVMGTSVVVCSEMYTSRTCANCYRLHLKLGSSDVFACPHCSYRAGRDANAALNILRYVCAGSLQVFS